MDTGEKGIIIVFSGTGNSLAAAKTLSRELDLPLHMICGREDKITDAHFDKLIFVVPSYAYGLPLPVKRFIKKSSFSADYTAAAVTCGSSAGGTLNSLKRMLKRRCVELNYGVDIQSVENFVPIFGRQSETKVEKRIKNQRECTNAFAANIKSGQNNKIKGLHPVSIIVSSIFTAAQPVIASMMRVRAKSCTKCGICAKACPAEAIAIKRRKAKIKKLRCTACQCCMNICPTNAITMLRKSAKTQSYINPDIEKSELIKR